MAQKKATVDKTGRAEANISRSTKINKSLLHRSIASKLDHENNPPKRKNEGKRYSSRLLQNRKAVRIVRQKSRKCVSFVSEQACAISSQTEG